MHGPKLWLNINRVRSTRTQTKQDAHAFAQAPAVNMQSTNVGLPVRCNLRVKTFMLQAWEGREATINLWRHSLGCNMWDFSQLGAQIASSIHKWLTLGDGPTTECPASSHTATAKSYSMLGKAFVHDTPSSESRVDHRRNQASSTAEISWPGTNIAISKLQNISFSRCVRSPGEGCYVFHLQFRVMSILGTSMRRRCQ